MKNISLIGPIGLIGLIGLILKTTKKIILYNKPQKKPCIVCKAFFILCYNNYFFFANFA